MKTIVLAVAVIGAFAAAGANAQSGTDETPEAVNEVLVNGNARPVANVNTPVGTAYFRYQFFGSGYTWHPTNVTPDSVNTPQAQPFESRD